MELLDPFLELGFQAIRRFDDLSRGVEQAYQAKINHFSQYCARAALPYPPGLCHPTSTYVADK